MPQIEIPLAIGSKEHVQIQSELFGNNKSVRIDENVEIKLAPMQYRTAEVSAQVIACYIIFYLGTRAVEKMIDKGLDVSIEKTAKFLYEKIRKYVDARISVGSVSIEALTEEQVRKIIREELQKLNCLGCKWATEIPNEYKIEQPIGNFVVNHSKDPKFFGHIIVMLKDHRNDRSISTLSPDEINEALLLAGKIAKMLPKAVEEISRTRVEMVYIATFSEDENWHTHIHIIPRPVNADPVGANVFCLPTVSVDKEQVQKLMNKLNAQIPLVLLFRRRFVYCFL